jgi:hypothetical protein
MVVLQKPRVWIFAGLVAFAFCPTPAAADYYGAIAFSKDDGAYGFSTDYDSRAGAEEEAQSECGDGCEVVLWFKNARGALAVGADRGYGTGWARSRGEAESIAMSECKNNSTNCSVLRWECTTRD